MSLLWFLLLLGVASGSHYRGGSISYSIRPASSNGSNSSTVQVRVTQRHSWRRTAFFCNDTSSTTKDFIGGDFLTSSQPTSGAIIPSIDASVQCTDYSEEFDYSSGESSTMVSLPLNARIEYFYQGCCWIPLLPPDAESRWSLKFVVNTKERADGTLNNSPKTTMNPIVQVQVSRVHVIRIPMADSDGDRVRCRWGNNESECGTICAPKGRLTSDPCELTYNATAVGYHAVALVIEDFDANNTVLSAIPLQFLIHIVNQTTTVTMCPDLPVYIGDWAADSCIGVQSNTTIKANIQVRIPCANSNTTLSNILTISPAGFERGVIERDAVDRQLYTMPVEWTPTADQYGIHQACFTPVDSHSRTGSQVCLTFQVNVLPPRFIDLLPSGSVLANQSIWTIVADRDIARSRRTSGVNIRFYQRSNDQLVYQVDVASDLSVLYDSREIVFFTTGHSWEQGEEYYILFDSGIATINESCGIESTAVQDPHAWVFRVEEDSTTATAIVPTTTTTTITTTATSVQNNRTNTTCPRWIPFSTVSNESTNANNPQLVFCFHVESVLADVTIAANTWVSCMAWKASGAADPLVELYSLPGNEFLAQNDDGSSHSVKNCYASVLSYRLGRGDYRVVIRHPKCSYGTFELRLSAEIDNSPSK